jgi:hypothetical protein
MFVFCCGLAALLQAATLCLAPVPAPRAADLDKYLPDDATAVAVVDAKQILAWAPFQKKIQPQLEMLLKNDEVKALLKDSGFDPLKDVDRIIVVSAPISGPTGGPTFALVQGRFDGAKLRAKAEAAAKEKPDFVKLRKVGDADLWVLHDHEFCALLDKDTIMLGATEALAVEALEKAAGKKKTALKDKRLKELLAKADPKQALQWFAVGDMGTGGSISNDGMGNVKVERRYLKEDGVESAQGGVTCGDGDLKFQMTLTAKDADGAKQLAAKMTDGLAGMTKGAAATAEKVKELTPVVECLKKVKITAAGDGVSVDAIGTAEEAAALVKAFFMIGEARTGTAPIETPATKDK